MVRGVFLVLQKELPLLGLKEQKGMQENPILLSQIQTYDP
jgi:hypothetical protein